MLQFRTASRFVDGPKKTLGDDSPVGLGAKRMGQWGLKLGASHLGEYGRRRPKKAAGGIKAVGWSPFPLPLEPRLKNPSIASKPYF